MSDERRREDAGMDDDESSGPLCSAALSRTSTDMVSVPRKARPAWKWIMGLNVKLAWLISLGFITGISWLVTQVAPRTVNVALPQAAAGERRDRTGAETTGRFSKPSIIESENSKKQNRTDRLVVADAPATRAPQVALPPISSLTQRVEADENKGVASDSPSGLGQLLVAMPDARPPAAGLSETHAVSVPSPFAATGAAAPPAEPAAPETYTVRRGDNLHKIAKKFMKSSSPAVIAALSKANPRVAARKNQVRIGETIFIPPLASPLEKLAAAPPPTTEAIAAAQPPEDRKAEKSAPARGKSTARTASASKSKAKSPAKVARGKSTGAKPASAAKPVESPAPAGQNNDAVVAAAPQGASAAATKADRTGRMPAKKESKASKALAKHDRDSSARGRVAAAVDDSRGKKKTAAGNRGKRSIVVAR